MYFLPFIFGFWIYYIPAGFPLGVLTFMVLLGSFNFLRATKPGGWLKTGEVLKLTSDCPGVPADIGGWAEATGMTLLDTVEISPGVFEFYIRKG